MKALTLSENRVLVTKEYDSFKRIAGNRPVSRQHVNRLKRKMTVKDLKVPILINGKAEVIDGQHRLQARRELELPVYYTVNPELGIEETQMANSITKNWAIDDFLHSYTEQNFAHYNRYEEFKNKYGFGHTVTTFLLQGGSINGNEDFNDGNFVVKDLRQAEEWAEKILQVAPYYKGYNRRSFAFALVKLFKTPEYNHEEFITKLSYQSYKMVDCTTIPHYIRLIEDIYNYKRGASQKVRFI